MKWPIGYTTVPLILQEDIVDGIVKSTADIQTKTTLPWDIEGKLLPPIFHLTRIIIRPREFN